MIKKHSFKVGFGFGYTSGIITTLGLMVGLYSGTKSELAVIGGILTIALADSFSDALGIHISEEAEDKHTTREIWETTLCTFFSKLIVTTMFVIPVLLFELSTAIIMSVIWGLLLLCIFSLKIAKEQNAKVFKVVLEHLVIALIVVTATHFLGVFISSVFFG